MNSSISNSNVRAWCCIALFMLTILGGMEVFSRLYTFHISKQSTWVDFPKRAQKLARASGAKVVIVGNSTTQFGVDSGRFEQALKNCGVEPVKAEKFAIGGTHINKWHYILKRFIWEPGCKPDLIVIPFMRHDLADSVDAPVSMLAQLVSGPKDWREVFKIDLQTSSEKAEFITASYWCTFAARDRIKGSLLAAAVPGYKRYAEQINAVNSRPKSLATPFQPVARTYQALARLQRYAHQFETKILFVAYPVRSSAQDTPYSLNPALLSAIDAGGMELLDLRNVTELTPDKYEDTVHLNDAGNKIWSRVLAEQVASHTMLKRQKVAANRIEQ